VYVRVDGTETREVLDHTGRFLSASADGSRVLLNDGCLYLVEAERCEAQLGSPASFKGILGASEKLGRVYFIDTTVLTGTQENANNEAAQAGKFNLYVWSEGDTKFIGSLVSEDNAFGLSSSRGDWEASAQDRTAQVSGDGEYLAFMSRARLTGYNNRIFANVEECRDGRSSACFKTFEYQAASNKLTCVSCNPTGRRPLGHSNLSLIRGAKGAPFAQLHNLPRRSCSALHRPHNRTGHRQERSATHDPGRHTAGHPLDRRDGRPGRIHAEPDQLRTDER
jgi:hypothetical protein